MNKYLFLVLMFTSSVASSTCWYGGYSYPTGSIVNGLTCQANGTWR